MAMEARLDLASRRNEARLIVLRFIGLDLTGQTMRQQVRLKADTPGTPILDLATVTAVNAQGLRLVGVSNEGGVPVSTVHITYNLTTMRDQIPYVGELGDDARLEHAIQIGPTTRIYGDWWALAAVIDSDNAPLDRAIGYGQTRYAPRPFNTAELTFAGQDVYEVIIDGVELLSPLLDRAEAAAAAVEETAHRLDDLSLIVPIGPLIEGERPEREERDASGRLMDVYTREGSHLFYTRAGMKRSNAQQGGLVPLGPLVGGERPINVETDHQGRFLRVETEEGGLWLPGVNGLERTAPRGPAPTRYAGPNWTAGSGVQQRIRAAVDDGVWILLVVLGQSNAMGQNGTSEPLVASSPIYPDNAWMFAGGPRRTDAVPNRDLVPLVESTTAGQRETVASGWANHLIRDIEAEAGVRPNVLAFVTALGATPLIQLDRGTPTYANYLRALDDAVASIRAKGGRRIITHFAWLQGQSDDTGMGLMTPSRRKRNLQTLVRQVRADAMSRTGEVEPCPFFIVQQSGQPFADAWYAPVRDADIAIDGDADVRLAGTDYFLPYVDLLHYTCVGQNRAGQMLARASAAEGFAQGVQAVKPWRHRWTSAAQFVVDFEMMTPPLVLDTSGAVVSVAGLTSSGFEFDDGSGTPPTISNISVVATGPYAGMALRFTLSAAPTGPHRRLGYAMRRDASQSGGYPGQNGPTIGPRGLLRDSTAHINLYDGAAQANWAPAFVIEL